MVCPHRRLFLIRSLAVCLSVMHVPYLKQSQASTSSVIQSVAEEMIDSIVVVVHMVCRMVEGR